MLLRSKIRDLSTIIFWLLSVGRVVDGSVNDVENSVVKTESTSNSERTTSEQGSFERSVSYIADQGGGITYHDFEEDDEDDLNSHRDVSKTDILLDEVTRYNLLQWHIRESILV